MVIPSIPYRAEWEEHDTLVKFIPKDLLLWDVHVDLEMMEFCVSRFSFIYLPVRPACYYFRDEESMPGKWLKFLIQRQEN